MSDVCRVCNGEGEIFYSTTSVPDIINMLTIKAPCWACRGAGRVEGNVSDQYIPEGYYVAEDADGERLVRKDSSNQSLSLEELTERFYVVRGQRNRLLWACRKVLDAFDEAQTTGKSTWPGNAVSEMRVAVAEASAIYQPTKYFGDARILTCANCHEESTNPGQFVGDGRWVCTEACRRELADAQSYDDLAASGGIVDAP